jgi:hypothetical protein
MASLLFNKTKARQSHILKGQVTPPFACAQLFFAEGTALGA